MDTFDTISRGILIALLIVIIFLLAIVTKEMQTYLIKMNTAIDIVREVFKQ